MKFYLKIILPATLPVKIILLKIFQTKYVFQTKYTLYPARGTRFSFAAILLQENFYGKVRMTLQESRAQKKLLYWIRPLKIIGWCCSVRGVPCSAVSEVECRRIRKWNSWRTYATYMKSKKYSKVLISREWIFGWLAPSPRQPFGKAWSLKKNIFHFKTNCCSVCLRRALCTSFRYFEINGLPN